MVDTEGKRRLTRLARQGKLDGDGGFKMVLGEFVRMGFTGDLLDYAEKPYFRSALWEAAWKNNEQTVKLLVEKNANLAFSDYQDRTPLHECAYYGHKSLVEFFLEKGHPIDCVDKFGQTPLCRAVEGGREEVVELLFSKKAHMNLVDTDLSNPGQLAAFKGMPDMSSWLMYKGSWKNRFLLDEKSATLITTGSPKAGTRDTATDLATEEEQEVATGGATGEQAAARPTPAKSGGGGRLDAN